MSIKTEQITNKLNAETNGLQPKIISLVKRLENVLATHITTISSLQTEIDKNGQYERRKNPHSN